jgi:O-antigen/teichoic acid export membrane protein
VANLPEYFLLIPVVITTPVLPVLSRLFKAAERRQFQQLYQTVFDVLMSGIVPAFVVALLMPASIVTWLFGAQYAEAASVLPLLAASIVFIWVSHVTAIAAVATGLQGCFIWIQSCCVTAFVLLSLTLIPTWGILGAGTARVVGAVIAPLLTYGVVAKRAGFTLNGHAVSRILFSGLVMSLTVVLIARVDDSLALFCGVMVYIGTLLTIGLPDWKILRERESGSYGA